MPLNSGVIFLFIAFHPVLNSAVEFLACLYSFHKIPFYLRLLPHSLSSGNFVFWVIILRIQSSYSLKNCLSLVADLVQSILFFFLSSAYYVYFLVFIIALRSSLFRVGGLFDNPLFNGALGDFSAFPGSLNLKLHDMHLHYKFCYSASRGAQRGANFMSRAGVVLRLTRHFSARLGTLASRPISAYLGCTSPCPLVCVPSAATPSISHEIPIHVSGIKLTRVGAVSCPVPECLSCLFRNGHIGDNWFRGKYPTFMEVPCDWTMCISSPHCIVHIVPY